MMNSKIITSTCILSLAFILGACGPIDETYEQVEFTEVTTSEITTSTTTALTSSLTAVSSDVSTVTTLNTTTALTSVTDGSTAIGTVSAETEAEKQQDNVQDNMQDKAETTTVHNDTTEYNDSKSSTSAAAVITIATETKTTDVTTTAVTEITTTAVTTVTTENNEPYLVYKPSTKYAHRSTCRWNKDDAYRCEDFSELETRICSECKPDVGDHIEYQTQTTGNANKDDMIYVGNFKMTYYPETYYYPGVCGGSARTLRGYGDYSDGIRGSVACRTIQEAYGYDRNGRTTVYLEFPSYPCMNGNYWIDDCCGAYGTIDVFVWSDAACPFGYDGITWADCWIY